MMTLRKSAQRGYADHGWLKSYHSFSFAEYLDPAQMGFGNLRVLNEDRVAPGMGFGSHGHCDMEIITVVLDGALAHRDSLGNGSTLRPGDVLRMTAGTGVRHSERNAAPDRATHFLQIWLLPAQSGLAPGYEQRHFQVQDRRGRLRLVAAPDGAEGALRLQAQARLWAGLFDGVAEQAVLALDPARKAYVHLASGALSVNGQRLQAGDALALQGEVDLRLTQGQQAEVLVFELAA